MMTFPHAFLKPPIAKQSAQLVESDVGVGSPVTAGLGPGLALHVCVLRRLPSGPDRTASISRQAGLPRDPRAPRRGAWARSTRCDAGGLERRSFDAPFIFPFLKSPA